MALRRLAPALLFLTAGACSGPPSPADAASADGGRDARASIDASADAAETPDAAPEAGLVDAATVDAADAGSTASPTRPVIYQLVVRLFGNTNETRARDGTIVQNGSGHFSDVTDDALAEIHALGATHVWLTGALRQATLTDWSSVDPALAADDPDVVKGRAGSFYAVRDYYDVSPDLADDPAHRLEEFDALVARIHAAGMQVVIDLVPNHVARSYHSVVHPEWDFGASDDQSRFFAGSNSFYYVSGGPLVLSHPSGWAPSGVVFDGHFAREDGTSGSIARATGNNAATLTPSANDWYETVKLNYGVDFTSGATAFSPMPTTWTLVDHVLAYWQARGVDGFRCDFAHYVPDEAWQYLIAEARGRDADAFFFAEAYDRLPGLLASGFDAVYHDATYDTLKSLYLGRSGQLELDAAYGALGDTDRNRYVEYLENHDERRLASPIVTSGGTDDSGFGGASAAHQLAVVQYLWSGGPLLMLNGQEVGELGAGAEGFGGDDGRTTIFDYWSMPSMVRWWNGTLTPDESALRGWYADLLALAQDPAVTSSRYWGLEYFDNTARFSDCPDTLFTFARFATGGGRVIVVVANFALGTATSGRIRLPADLAAAAGLPSARALTVRRIFGVEGAASETVAATSVADLGTTGFPVSVPDQAASVYVIE
ncbi:MAG: alpha-amylase family glycosyl hydrolase [Sandaracinus sp.]